jgi:hypothetical protein
MRFFKCAAFAICIALRASVALAWGEHTLIPNLVRRSDFIQRTAATAYQRRIAERNAKTFFSHLPPAKKEELIKKKIKSVLISTVRSPQTSPQAKDVRMRFSLEGDLENNDAWEFKAALPARATMQIEGREEYIE